MYGMTFPYIPGSRPATAARVLALCPVAVVIGSQIMSSIISVIFLPIGLLLVISTTVGSWKALPAYSSGIIVSLNAPGSLVTARPVSGSSIRL